MGSNSIRLTTVTCGVMAAFKTLNLEVMVQIHSGYQNMVSLVYAVKRLAVNEKNRVRIPKSPKKGTVAKLVNAMH